MLPELRSLLARIRDARRAVLAGGRRIRATAVGNGGGREAPAYWRALAELREGVRSIGDRGILLRDPDRGLVDFPSTRDGRPVFLCWRMDEDRVAHWHGTESGYGGRKPL